MGISSVIEMLAALLSEVTRMGLDRTLVLESEAKSCNWAIILSGSPMKKLPPFRNVAAADPMESPRLVALVSLELIPPATVVEPAEPLKASSSHASVDSSISRSTINTSIKTCCGKRSSLLIRASIAG